MNIVVAMKEAPDLVEDLEVDDSGTCLDPDETEYKLNEFDDHALEEAILLKEAGGGTVTVVAIGGESVDKTCFTALAKGADKAIKVEVDEDEPFSGNYEMAQVFAAAIKDQGFDLVLTGVQASDDRDGHIGPILAEMLGAPSASVVADVNISGDTASFKKEFGGGVLAEYEVKLPAVLGVQAAKQSPRYVPVSKVRQIQKSAELDTFEADDLDAPLSKVTAMAPPETGDGAEMLSDVAALVKVLEDKGALS